MHVIKKINVAKTILGQLFSVILFFGLKYYQTFQTAQVNYSKENHIVLTIHGWLGLTYSPMILGFKIKRAEYIKVSKTLISESQKYNYSDGICTLD